MTHEPYSAHPTETGPMRGLLGADLGVDALARPGRVARVRHVRRGTTRVVVDTPDEVDLVVNLSDGHQVDGRLSGVPTMRRRAACATESDSRAATSRPSP